jgi:hypothetical protein
MATSGLVETGCRRVRNQRGSVGKDARYLSKLGKLLAQMQRENRNLLLYKARGITRNSQRPTQKYAIGIFLNS